MGSRTTDPDILRQQFLTACDRFLPRVEAYTHGRASQDFERATDGVARMRAEWSRVIVDRLEMLARLDDTLQTSQNIARFVETVDIAMIATKSGMSTTSRGVLAMVQRDVVDIARGLVPALASEADQLLRSGRIPSDAIIARMHDTSREIGPIIARSVRHCAPLMNAGERAELHELIARVAVDRVLEVRRIPIDTERPIHEQVLTLGSLVPLTQSMNRNSFFGIFACTYDMQESLEVNIAKLATVIDANVVFISKIIANAQEFDSRAIFDSGFIERNGLSVPEFTGLCDKIIARFDTIHSLSQSRARVPFYFKHDRASSESGTARRTLIMESLVGNLFRIVGIPHRATTTRGPKNISEYITANADCSFLLEGQSTRADAYGARAEDAIFAGGRTEFAQSVASMGAAAAAERANIASALFARIDEFARQYVHSDKMIKEPIIDDIFDLCVLAYEKISKSNDIATVSYQLFALAKKLWMAISERWSELIEMEYDARERAISDVIASFARETEFSVGESENAIMLRKLAA